MYVKSIKKYDEKYSLQNGKHCIKHLFYMSKHLNHQVKDVIGSSHKALKNVIGSLDEAIE